MLRSVAFVAFLSVAVSATYQRSSYSSSYGSSYGSPRAYKSGSYSLSAPAVSYSTIAAPALSYSTVAAAPAVSYISAPATSYVAAAPATSYVAAAPAVSYGSSLGSYESSGPITAAVQSHRTVKTYDVPSTFSGSSALTIDVPSSSQSMNFLMRSRSSDINLETVHEPTPGSFKETASEEEPHISRHTVTRPLIQEVREVVTPFRKIVQELQPVQEHVETIVPRGHQESYVAAPAAATTATQLVAAQPVAVAAQPVAVAAQPVAVAAQPVAVAAQPVAVAQYVQPVSTIAAAPLVTGYSSGSYSSYSAPKFSYSSYGKRSSYSKPY